MKLPKAKFGFSSKDKFVEFELEVKIAQDFRFYFQVEKLPSELLALDSRPPGLRAYFDSFHELERCILGLIEELEVSFVEENKSKVILYAISRGDRHGQQIDLKFIVVQKVDLRQWGSKGQFNSVRYFTEQLNSGYQVSTVLNEFNTYTVFEDKFLEMAWSAEREAWFKEIETAIDKLGNRLENGFGTKPEVLARKIDQGAKLLLRGSNDA